MRKESETVFCSKCVREGGNVEMDFHEGCMFQGAEHQVTEMPWVSKNTLQCESLHVTAPNLDFTYSADNFIPLVSANVVNERRGNDLAPVCFKLRLYELAASVELRSHREELWAEKERWDLGWVREGGCRGGVSLPVPALRYCVSSLGTLHRSRLLNSNQWHQDRRGGVREGGRETKRKIAKRQRERESEESETWGGRWNAKLTVLLHYLPDGRASVKGKEGKERRGWGGDLLEDAVGFHEVCDVKAI